MSQASFTFHVHGERLSIARLERDAPLPAWVHGRFVNVARTPTELSIVCAQAHVPPGVLRERDKIALFIEGTVPMTAVGIIASLSRALADAGVPIFVIATFDTDYILVPEARLGVAIEVLQEAGHAVTQ